MRIGFFAGSFNPVHIGHLAIANYLAEYEGYDKIWFSITPQNPLKNKNKLMNQNLRLRLLQKSIQDYNKFEICTVELDILQPSYTINTLCKLKTDYPQNTFELIIGSDNWITFHYWKDYRTILEDFKILIYPRSNCESICSNHPNVYLCKNAPKIEISSTFIRQSIVEGKDIRFYMPEGIYKEVINSESVISSKFI